MRLAAGERVELAMATGLRLRVVRHVVQGAATVVAQALLMARSDAWDRERRRSKILERFAFASGLVDAALAAEEITPAEAMELRTHIDGRDLASLLRRAHTLGEAARARLAAGLGRSPIEVSVGEGPSTVVVEATGARASPGSSVVLVVELVAGPDGAEVDIGTVEAG